MQEVRIELQQEENMEAELWNGIEQELKKFLLFSITMFVCMLVTVAIV